MWWDLRYSRHFWKRVLKKYDLSCDGYIVQFLLKLYHMITRYIVHTGKVNARNLLSKVTCNNMWSSVSPGRRWTTGEWKLDRETVNCFAALDSQPARGLRSSLCCWTLRYSLWSELWFTLLYQLQGSTGAAYKHHIHDLHFSMFDSNAAYKRLNGQGTQGNHAPLSVLHESI